MNGGIDDRIDGGWWRAHDAGLAWKISSHFVLFDIGQQTLK